jgi:hypothetical protein
MKPHESSSKSSGEARPSGLSRQGFIRDARDRKVKQLDPVAMNLLRQHDVIEADTLRAIAHERGVEITEWERIFLVGGVVALVLVVGFFVHSIVTRDFGTAAFARSASLVYFSIVPWVVWVGVKKSRFEKVAAAMLKHGRCPHCGYNLKGLPPDEQDGATVCSECGCAWNLASPPGSA